MSKEAGAPESDRLEGAPHPREQDEFFGHDAAEQALLAAYRQNRMAQAWIIGGPEGVGKAARAVPARASGRFGAASAKGAIPLRPDRQSGGAADRHDGVGGYFSPAARLEREDQEILYRNPHRRRS
jgi:hypothetical protein